MIEKQNKNLKKVRRSIGMTQGDLGRLTDTSASYISDLENGKVRDPSLGRARLIAYYLGVDVETIFPTDREFIK